MIHYSIEIRDVEPICSVFRYFLGEEKGACRKILQQLLVNSPQTSLDY